MVSSQKVSKTAIAGICIVFVALRLFRLTDSCLWFDEIFSVHAATHSWDSLFSFVALDLIHPPLFYVLLKLWIGVGGESLLWLRLFPVVFSVIAIFPFISLCRELKLSFWTQILALFFFATNGSLIKYAQEVRMYSVLLCFSLFSMWLFARFFVKGKSFTLLVLVNIILVYTHYFGWFVVLSEVAAIVMFQRIKSRRILTMFGVISAIFVPWIYAVWQASRAGSGLGQNIGWMTRPGPEAVGQFVLNLIEPFYYQASSVDPISVFRVSLPVLLIVGVAAGLYFANWNKQSDGERQTVNLLGLFVVLPLLTAFAVSWLLPYSIWGTRHLIVVFAPVSIILAIAITRISLPAVQTAAITLIVLFSGYAFVQASVREKAEYSWCSWEPLAVYAFDAGPGNIYVFEDLVAYHFWYGLKRHDSEERSVIKVTNVDGITEDKSYFLPRGFEDVRSIDAAEITEPSLFVAFRAKQLDETKQPMKSFLERGYRVKDRHVYRAKGEDTILVYLEK